MNSRPIIASLGVFSLTFLGGRFIPQKSDSKASDKPSAQASSRRPPPSQTLTNSPTLASEATKVPPDDFAAWLTDHRLDHLSTEEQSLIRSIIKERWVKIDPAACTKFLISRNDPHLVWYYAKWLKANRGEALNYPSLLEPHQQARVYGFLMSALAETDAPAALDLLLQNPSSFKDGGSYHLTETFPIIAHHDRNALLNFVEQETPWKEQALKALVATWLDQDLLWTIKALEKTHTGPEIFKGIVYIRSAEFGTAILQNLDQIPTSWHDELANGSDLLRGAELDWLRLKSHPALDSETLQKIQKNAASGAFNGRQFLKHQDPDEVLKIIQTATWLNPETRGLLAITLSSQFRKDRAFTEEFVLKMPSELASYSSEILTQLEKSENYFSLERQMIKPKGLIDALLAAEDRIHIPMEVEQWGEAKIEEVIQHANSLSNQDALRILKQDTFRDLPPELTATLISKASQLEDNPTGSDLQHPASEAARKWAEVAPQDAAIWAASLPEGITRTRALQSATSQWANYDKEELSTWLNTLSAKDREQFGGQ